MWNVLHNRPTTEQAEMDARTYCRKEGKDPDEMVLGRDDRWLGTTDTVSLPRWQWYLGVSEAALRVPIP
jgi:hypothetical protein